MPWKKTMKTSLTDIRPVLLDRVKTHLEKIYPGMDHEAMARRAAEIFHAPVCTGPGQPSPAPPAWSQEDMILITYGDSIIQPDERPLKTLHHFLETFVKDLFSIVHILPFFPFSSDDGFAVMDYYTVNPALGEWADIERIAGRCRLMADLVINHTSSRALWFENFKKGQHPGKDYYVAIDPASDLSQVVRPRTSPLLKEVTTEEGTCHVWCTFSHDQVDLNFKNPEVLFEFLAIIRYYLDRGVQLFRLDAVAFLWKETCTTCLHLGQTHEIIKLFRTLIQAYASQALLITETNVPSNENLSYLGQGDEAHVIYNFPLPPLLLNTLVSGNSRLLTTWLKELPPLMPGTTYLNFIASHDGIGLRPVEGLLYNNRMNRFISCMKSFGARISTRALNDHEANPYEINISLWDAMKGTLDRGVDDFQLARFVCAHAVMLALKGIPAFYIHSILGTENDYDRRDNLGSNRAVNRHIWDFKELQKKLNTPKSHHHQVFHHLTRLAALRRATPAFHPEAGQEILDMGDRIVAIQREIEPWQERPGQTLLCIHNISDTAVETRFPEMPEGVETRGKDLITGRPVSLLDSLCLEPYRFAWICLT